MPQHLSHLPYDQLQFTLVDCPGGWWGCWGWLGLGRPSLRARGNGAVQRAVCKAACGRAGRR